MTLLDIIGLVIAGIGFVLMIVCAIMLRRVMK